MVSGKDVAHSAGNFTDYNHGALGEFHEPPAMPARARLGHLATGAHGVFDQGQRHRPLILPLLSMVG
jgi:hypothetical protein